MGREETASALDVADLTREAELESVDAEVAVAEAVAVAVAVAADKAVVVAENIRSADTFAEGRRFAAAAAAGVVPADIHSHLALEGQAVRNLSVMPEVIADAGAAELVGYRHS